MFFNDINPVKNGFLLSNTPEKLVFLLNSKDQAKFEFKIAGVEKDAIFLVTAENEQIALDEVAVFCKKNALSDFYITRQDFLDELTESDINQTVDQYAFEAGYSKTNRNVYFKLYDLKIVC